MSQSSSETLISLAVVCVGAGPSGSVGIPARVTLVDFHGTTVLDVYIRPTPGLEVTDYRTSSTGIHPGHLYSRDAVDFNVVQQRVIKYIRGRILVGHSIWSFLSVLGTPHPAVLTRDVALYLPFRTALRSAPNQVIGLPTLLWHLMRRKCQETQLDSLENARAALDLYRSAPEWEMSISKGRWPCAIPPSSFSKCYM